MPEAGHVLGIDFGTANSYFCKFLVDPNGHKIRLIDFGNKQLGGLSTTILYRKNRSSVVGRTAEQEWGEATPKERRNYTLRTHFKPEIALSKEARGDAVAYLETIRKQMEARRIDFDPGRHRVIIGTPGEADETFKETLGQIAEEAGYGRVRLIYEPVGALLYHLWNKDISPDETQRGVLVVDFGGGTCDFTYMQRLEVRGAWGDFQLGGRLFDDLFFQWFLDQNPRALKKLVANGDEYYVHWLICREAKEAFSEAMLMNRSETVRLKLGQLKDYGSFRDLTWDAFMERARNYRPHSGFIKYLKERQLQSGKLVGDKSINLLAWFRESLVSGLEERSIRSSDIERVILTGGSSQWPFVKDIVCEELHIDERQLLTSENPQAAISEGLVVLPSLQMKYEKVSDKLKQDLDTFFRETIEPEINRRLSHIIGQILKDITIKLYDGQISPLIYDFRKKGGTIAMLKEKIRLATINFMPEIEDSIRKKLQELNEGLPEALHELVHDWFEENGVSYYGERVDSEHFPRGYNAASLAAEPEGIDAFQQDLMDITGGFVITLSATIVATLSGGAHTALIMSGPLGWLIGAVIGAITTYVAWEYGRDKISEMIENMELPAGLVKVILRESRIKAILQEGREKLKTQLRGEIEQAIQNPLNEMKQKIMLNIEQEIRSLTLINHL